jgi:hypothetical protein
MLRSSGRSESRSLTTGSEGEAKDDAHAGLGMRPHRNRRLLKACLRLGAAGREGGDRDRLLKRALAFYRAFGTEVERLMTDNGSAYKSTVHAVACQTRPYRPQSNGKAERFIRTMLAEWAYALVYGSSSERARPSRPGSTGTTSGEDTVPSASARRCGACSWHLRDLSFSAFMRKPSGVRISGGVPNSAKLAMNAAHASRPLNIKARPFGPRHFEHLTQVKPLPVFPCRGNPEGAIWAFGGPLTPAHPADRG